MSAMKRIGAGLICCFLISISVGGCGNDVTQPSTPCEMTPFVDPEGLSLHFIVDQQEQGGRGYYWEGANWGTAAEELAGRAELVKEDGWLKVVDTWSYDSATGQYVKSIFGAFAGVALNIFEPISSEPYIALPTDPGQFWHSDTVFQTCPDQDEVERSFIYTITEVGNADILLNGTSVQSYENVIKYRAAANEGTDSLAVWLAPDVGIIYSVYTSCEITSLASLVGYKGENRDFTTGEEISDYFPLAPCAHWLYEFSKDYEEGEIIDFRLKIREGP
ncbi:MAG: hypothetical protein ACE5OP_11415 [Candidatus Glassbacteria bacterium]